MQENESSRTPLALALTLATVALFTASASWTLFAVAGVHLKHRLHLSETAFGILLAMPMLVGGLAALVLGMLTHRIGGRRLILGCLGALIFALGGFLLVETLAGFIAVGSGLGLAGGGLFGAGLHYSASRSPARKAGLSLGCYSAGMLGAGFTYLIVPLMHSAYEWQLAPLAYIVITLVALLLLLVLTDPEPVEIAGIPSSPPLPIARLRMGYFCLYYAYLFGSFVALALWLPAYLSESYGLSLTAGASLSLLFTLPGALAQIPGGALADRIGPAPVLRWVMGISLLALLLLCYPSTQMSIRGISGQLSLSISLPLPMVVALLAVLGTALGLGLGSQMRLLCDTYPGRTGSVGGAMLFSGCLAASVLPLLFGLSNDLLGIRSAAFMMVFLLAAVCTWGLFHSARQEERKRLLNGTLSLKG